jgi:hypothetical protein
VPKLTRENLPTLFAYVRDLMRPFKTRFWGLMGINLLLGMGITYAEQYVFFKRVLPEMQRRQEEEAEIEEQRTRDSLTHGKPKQIVRF